MEEFLGGSPCLLDCLCFSYKNEAKRGRILRRQSLSSGIVYALATKMRPSVEEFLGDSQSLSSGLSML